MHWHTHSRSPAWRAAGTGSEPALTGVGQQSWWLPPVGEVLLSQSGLQELPSGTGRGVPGSKLHPKSPADPEDQTCPCQSP